jgi:hypothetical protein
MNDYKALVDEMRLKGQPPEHLGNRLADAVEALVAENEKLRDGYRVMHDFADERAAERDALREENDRLRVMWDQSGKNDLIAERDALRAQLDNMTIEWGWCYDVDADPTPTHVDRRPESVARGMVALDPEARVLVQRSVGPWVEVAD